YDDFDTLIQEIQNWANSAGFTVRKARANNPVKNFGNTRIEISCVRDAVRPGVAHSRPRTSTNKVNCT
ncbi:hypothetical protein V8F06_014963, partial [Rhypophila decipiens]